MTASRQPTSEQHDAAPVRTAALEERGEVVAAFVAAMRRRGLMQSTILTRCYVVRHWWDYLEGQGLHPFKGASRRHVEAFVDASDMTAASSIASALSHLHRFYLFARREGLVTRNPVELVERPRIIPRLPRPISDTDLAVALTLADGPVRAAIILAATSGLRCIELAGLRWDDVDMVNASARVTGKGGRDRVVPLHRDAVDALDALPRDDRYVLPWRVSTNSSPGVRVSHNVNKFLRSVGVNATAHQLRHWCGTNALAGTKDLRAVQDLLGHANPAHTALYTKVNPDNLRHAVDAIRLPGLTPAGEYEASTEERV
jgi:integrase/recombinase XerD